MSAIEPTKQEMLDLVTIVVPRIIAEAMSNPEGEWYKGEIIDEAIERALKMSIEIDDQFYIIHHQDGWSDNHLPWLVCCGEEFDVNKHDSYTRFDGWNCPNETAEVASAHPPKKVKFISMKIDSI